MASVYEELHQIVDQLPEDEASWWLGRMRDRQMRELWTALQQAPLEDEEISEAEEADAAAGREEWLRGEGRPLREVWEELRRERRV
jgi:hypothetical protein